MQNSTVSNEIGIPERQHALFRSGRNSAKLPANLQTSSPPLPAGPGADVPKGTSDGFGRKGIASICDICGSAQANSESVLVRGFRDRWTVFRLLLAVRAHSRGCVDLLRNALNAETFQSIDETTRLPAKSQE
jgi:hypothetical protein